MFLFQASLAGGLPMGHDKRWFSSPGNITNARRQSILPDFQSMSFGGGGVGLGDAAQGAALPASPEFRHTAPSLAPSAHSD